MRVFSENLLAFLGLLVMVLLGCILLALYVLSGSQRICVYPKGVDVRNEQ